LKKNRDLNVELVQPTIIPINPALHKSFYGKTSQNSPQITLSLTGKSLPQGMAYTPRGAIMPECSTNLSDIDRDVQILAQLTTRIRLYGSDWCEPYLSTHLTIVDESFPLVMSHLM
jgi:hypothetical protein